MAFNPDQVNFFAETDARGKRTPFGIKAKDRQRHMYVIGKTGMGKSTLLENMAVQDIQNGEGMAFIDPHGSAAETLLDYIPEHRINDVIYFAPFDMENPISFNVMEDVGADKRHLVVSGLMSTFKKIWVDAWSARMEYILTNALLALIEYPDTTLLSVNRLFSDKAYRERVVDYVKDPAVKAFWTEEFASYTDRFAAEALPAIQNKIGQFTGNPLIRNIIGQPHSSFDIRKIMDERKILIMNLSKGLVGETNANLLGSMLTTRIYLAAMSRANLDLETMQQMPNFYFYVDEFQSFANSTFSNILSEARKYHLNLIIAHQYIAQMEEEVRDAVFGNVGTTVAFRVGPLDGEMLEQVFTPRFLAADLVNLGFAQIYLSLMIDGIGSPPFSAVTMPPITKPEVSCKRMVIAASRRNFTHPRVEVEQIVADLHTPTEPAKPKSTNNRNNNNKSGGGGGKPAPQAKNASRSAPTNNAPKRSAPPPTDRSESLPHQSAARQAGNDTPPQRSTPPKKEKDPATQLSELRSVLADLTKPDDKTGKKSTADAGPARATAAAPKNDSSPAKADAAPRSAPSETRPKEKTTETQSPMSSRPDRPHDRKSKDTRMSDRSSRPRSADTTPAPPARAKASTTNAKPATSSQQRPARPDTRAQSRPHAKADAASPSASDTKSNRPDPKADLRSALQSVLAENDASKPSTSKPATSSNTPPPHDVKSAGAPSSQKTSAASADTTQKKQTQPDPLDPKHLERMIKTGGPSKSPFA